MKSNEQTGRPDGPDTGSYGDLKNHPGLQKSLAHFQRAKGPDLIARAEPLIQWQDQRRSIGVWPYSRSLQGSATAQTIIHTEQGKQVQGINFASQDYLSLSRHPAIMEAAIRAVRDFGVHSAGSANLIGNTSLSLALETAIGELIAMNHVLLFPTGWGAGYGTITGLIRSEDHVVLDHLAHACLQAGANAATSNVHRYRHLDSKALATTLKDIRAQDSRNSILVVTEGLFSMDSDIPDLSHVHTVCREWGASLLVDVAHDLGATGPAGAGSLGIQKMLGQVDFVVGAFSKSFASNGGFLATNFRSVHQFVKMYGGPHMFSNALSPIQAAIVLEAIRIIRGDEGAQLRRDLASRILELRTELETHGLCCLGSPSPIVPVHIGNEKIARVASALLQQKGVLTNLCEFPAVAVNSARFRMQVMSAHQPDQVTAAATAVAESVREASQKVAAIFQPAHSEETPYS